MKNLCRGANQGIGKRACSRKYNVKTRLDFDSYSQTNFLAIISSYFFSMQNHTFHDQLSKPFAGDKVPSINSCAHLQSSQDIKLVFSFLCVSSFQHFFFFTISIYFGLPIKNLYTFFTIPALLNWISRGKLSPNDQSITVCNESTSLICIHDGTSFVPFLGEVKKGHLNNFQYSVVQMRNLS